MQLHRSSALVQAFASPAILTKSTYESVITNYVRTHPSLLNAVGSFSDECVILPMDKLFKPSNANNEAINLSETGWKCSVCLGVPRDPASLERCGHAGCMKCFREILVTGGGLLNETTGTIGFKPCPVCRTQFAANEIIEYASWPLLAKQSWAMMRVKCENCEFVADPISVARHERNICLQRSVVCPGCTFTGRFKETVDHALQCASVMIHCSQCAFPFRYVEREKHNCNNFLYHLRRHPDAPIKSGRPCTISHSIVSADDWRVLFDDGNDTSWSPTTPVGLVEEGWEPVSTSTPPTASSQQPGYPTLSDVARLQRNQENTPPGQRVNQAGTSSSTQTAASSVTQTVGTPPNVHLVEGHFGRPIRRGTRAAQGRNIFN
jgi:hypothetical protein